MTATLTSDFVYTDEVSPDSKAIHRMFYNSVNQRLVVETWTGVLAGYEHVPADVWTAFKNSDSKGQYWNFWIKPNFKGFDTGGIAYFKEISGPPDPVSGNVIADSPVEVNEEEDVDSSLWSVSFVDDEGYAADELYVYAESLTNAIQAAENVAFLAGWKNARVVAVSEA